MRASQFPPTSSFRRQHRHHRPKHFVSSVSGTCSMCKRRSVTRRFSPSPSHLVLTTRGGWTMSIFLSAAPVQGKWVVIKCDSGPGRLNPDLLAYLHYHGFLLYPGVPNTTAVSQETEQSLVRFSQPSEQTYNSSSMREFAKMRQGLYCRGLLALWSLADAIRKQG